MPKLTINYACIADVVPVEPKEGDNQQKNRKVILHVDEEDFFDMLDHVNPKNIIKYLDMRGIAHREPANIVVKVKPDASGLKLRHSLKRVATELRNARENANEPINLHQEAFAIHWVRLAAEALASPTHFICNDLKLPKRLSQEEQTFLMLQLIAREPRPFVEYLESGCTHLRRAEVVGDGTKKSPFRAQWRNDYYK